MFTAGAWVHLRSAVAELESRVRAVSAAMDAEGREGVSPDRLRALLGDDAGGVGDALQDLWGPVVWDSVE